MEGCRGRGARDDRLEGARHGDVPGVREDVREELPQPEILRPGVQGRAGQEGREAQGYGLTLRQLYYQMVSRDIIPNNIRSYKNLGNLINDARLAGLVDWHAIEDRTRNLRRRPHWEEPQEIIDAIARQYHIDYWEGQENYVEVWVEKDALIGIVEQISDKLDVACFSCRGYTSQSELWGAAMRLKRRCDAGQHAVLLHLGDHDPSGKDMSRDIVARLELFGADDVEFRRLALNLDQIEEFGPPPNPTKLSDSRAQGYIERFGYECWELDALDPSVISRLIDENVRMYRDEGLYRDVLMRENEEKGTLRDLRDGYQGLIQNWSEICENYDIYQ